MRSDGRELCSHVLFYVPAKSFDRLLDQALAWLQATLADRLLHTLGRVINVSLKAVEDPGRKLIAWRNALGLGRCVLPTNRGPDYEQNANAGQIPTLYSLGSLR